MIALRGGQAGSAMRVGLQWQAPTQGVRAHHLQEDEPLGGGLLLELIAAPLGQQSLSLCGAGVGSTAGRRAGWHVGGRARARVRRVCRSVGGCPWSRRAVERGLAKQPQTCLKQSPQVQGAPTESGGGAALSIAATRGRPRPSGPVRLRWGNSPPVVKPLPGTKSFLAPSLCSPSGL